MLKSLTKIWKYEILLNDQLYLNLPAEFTILHVGVQNNTLMLWGEFPCDVNNIKLVTRKFEIILTDEQYDSNELMYLGTFEIVAPNGCDFVGHLFERV